MKTKSKVAVIKVDIAIKEQLKLFGRVQGLSLHDVTSKAISEYIDRIKQQLKSEPDSIIDKILQDADAMV